MYNQCESKYHIRSLGQYSNSIPTRAIFFSFLNKQGEIFSQPVFIYYGMHARFAVL